MSIASWWRARAARRAAALRSRLVAQSVADLKAMVPADLDPRDRTLLLERMDASAARAGHPPVQDSQSRD